MEVKDLTGLSKPLTKLIEVIAAGCGRIYEPKHIRRMAQAKADEIRLISAALSECSVNPMLLDYRNGFITLQGENKSEQFAIPAEYKNLLLRASIKQQHCLAEKQKNIDTISAIAAKELDGEKDVSESPLDNDWITRFFGIAEDISEAQMQDLWGRVLAGEVRRPGSYSLRCLEILKNITKEEAEVFCKVASFAFQRDGQYAIYKAENMFNGKFGIKYDDIILLQDLLLLHTNLLQMTYSGSGPLAIVYANKVIISWNFPESSKTKLNVVAFTKVGSELLNLVDTEFNSEYLKILLRWLKINDDTRVSIADFLFYDDIKKEIQYTGLIDWQE